MTNSPAPLRSPARDSLPPRLGGNLAPLKAIPERGHFLFPQPPDDGAADISNPDEAAVLPSASRGAGARILARPRPLPFPQINNVAHSAPPEAETTGTAIPTGGKFIREERNGPNI